ncbi:hypothetical protein [Nocardia macrotermitis]|uniref:Uncharacterized protein n=1 Tax=Nocardia macrotermitis TaxID=2585198 RepID=A0A7K0DGG9_9NOCA|nr:hypothetical protein [Nocardia macrotermitis]MQY24392.1 hypothetical protein [Nocardia macrotermitis]
MADDKDSTTQRPLTGLINDAKAGNLTIRMDLDSFVHIDRDCTLFKAQIRVVQRRMREISRQEHWGLGEDYVAKGGKDLISAKTMVARWRAKAEGQKDGNSVYAILDSHYQTVDDFQTLFRTIREQITDHDTTQAAKYKQLEASLPQEAMAPQRLSTVTQALPGVMPQLFKNVQ